MYQGVSLRVDARQWLLTHSRQRPGGTSGAQNRSLCYWMAVGHGKDADRHAIAVGNAARPAITLSDR
jgi:hypothetical protein